MLGKICIINGKVRKSHDPLITLEIHPIYEVRYVFWVQMFKEFK